MNLFVPNIEAQPNFPKEDVTLENARMLEVILANEEIVSQMHTETERVSNVFQEGRRAIEYSINRVYDPDKIQPIDHGVVLFGAAAGLLSADIKPSGALTFHKKCEIKSLSEEGLDEYFTQAHISFRADMPHAATAVAAATERFSRLLQSTQYLEQP